MNGIQLKSFAKDLNLLSCSHLSNRGISLFGNKEEKKKKEKLLTEFEKEIAAEEEKREQIRLARLCDKSGLRSQDLRVLLNQPPKPSFNDFTKIKNVRKLYGFYGTESEVPVKALWPSQSELEDLKAREEFVYPHSLSKSISIAKQKIAEEEENKIKLDKLTEERHKKLPEQLKKYANKIAADQKASDLTLAKRQERSEKIYRILGYKTHSRDAKFKEIEEKMLLDEKKEKKAVKKQMKLERSKYYVSKYYGAKKAESATTETGNAKSATTEAGNAESGNAASVTAESATTEIGNEASVTAESKKTEAGNQESTNPETENKS